MLIKKFEGRNPLPEWGWQVQGSLATSAHRYLIGKGDGHKHYASIKKPLLQGTG